MVLFLLPILQSSIHISSGIIHDRKRKVECRWVNYGNILDGVLYRYKIMLNEEECEKLHK